MAKIPINTKTTEFVYQNRPDIIEPFGRPYLGMSGIGDDCLRKVWFGFRFASIKKITRRLKLIFDRGHREEEIIIAELKEIGLEIFRRDEDGGKVEIFGIEGEKQEQAVGFFEHEKGHIDGRVLGVVEAPTTEHLLEMKTMNDSRFKKFKKEGVKNSDPKYYAQIQKYMHHKKLTRTLFVARNKNDEMLGFERIHYDKDYSEILEKKTADLITSDSPEFFQKLTRSDYRCKFCDHFEVCHNDAAPVKTCRSCVHVDLAHEGKWVCGLDGDKELSFEEQKIGCSKYKRLF